VAAKEGIKARQFLLEGVTNTKFSHTDVFELKTELNNILGSLGLKNGKIRSINKLRNDGTLIEMDSEAATTWITNQENQVKLCNKIGEGVSFRTRVHNLIAYNVPLGITPEDVKHRQEVCEANNIDSEVITTMKWVKAVHRRAQDQRTAHLFLTFNSADAANRAITNGLYICNRRCRTERVKREPTRCLKCQGWNHFAKECIEEHDKCGNCAEDHRTNECPSPLKRKCVSCKADDHASWSRECPTFIKKLSEFNERNPENALQYIPTADPWTWTASAKQPHQPQPSQPIRQVRPPTGNERHTQDKRTRAPLAPRLYDTYIPVYDKAGKRVQDNDQNDKTPIDLREFRPITQDYIDTVNESEDPRNPINPITVAPF
jgi:hypothetical protein